MPPCRAEYLAGFLFEIGPTVGGHTITHSEIESWQRNIGVDLNAWESGVIRRLSGAYIRQSEDSLSHDCEPPYQTEESKRAEAIAKAEITKQNLRDLAK